MALRVGVVGLGSRGLDWTRIVRATSGVTLAGGVEPDANVRAQCARRPECADAPLHADLASLVDAVRPDAVVVAVPPTFHAVVVEQALEAGLGVIVEKPFTVTLDEAVRLTHLAETRRRPLIVAQNYRYMRAHRTVRRLVAENALGTISDVACHYWRATHVVNAGLAALDASALWETGVHHLDALRVALDQRVVGVAADVATEPWAVGLTGTSARLLLEFDGGTRGVYTVSWGSRGHEFFEAGQQFYQRLTGERGTLHVIQRWLVLCQAGRWPRLVARGRRAEPEESVLLRQLLDALAGTAEPECSARDNLQTIAVLEAAMIAWRERKWVDPQALLHQVGADADRAEPSEGHRP